MLFFCKFRVFKVVIEDIIGMSLSLSLSPKLHTYCNQFPKFKDLER